MPKPGPLGTAIVGAGARSVNCSRKILGARSSSNKAGTFARRGTAVGIADIRCNVAAREILEPH